YDIVMTLDHTLKTAGTQNFPRVTCQVVGVAIKAERDQILATTVSSQLGKSAADLKASNVLTFDPSQAANGSMVISKTNPMWTAWKSPQFIIVTANIPDVKAGAGGNVNDPRRVWFSTNKLRWDAGKATIKFRVMRDRIMKETAETPLDPKLVTPDEF
ncbi:MAG: hypothetical protein AABZ53_01470, partial [Planctomycetota bacterium]